MSALPARPIATLIRTLIRFFSVFAIWASSDLRADLVLHAHLAHTRISMASPTLRAYRAQPTPPPHTMRAPSQPTANASNTILGPITDLACHARWANSITKGAQRHVPSAELVPSCRQVVCADAWKDTQAQTTAFALSVLLASSKTHWDRRRASTALQIPRASGEIASALVRLATSVKINSA